MSKRIRMNFQKSLTLNFQEDMPYLPDFCYFYIVNDIDV
jgi:hypothetical protein